MVSYLSMKKLKCADYSESTSEVKIETPQYRETIRSYINTQKSLSLRSLLEFCLLDSIKEFSYKSMHRNHHYRKYHYRKYTLRFICGDELFNKKIYLKIRKRPIMHSKHISDYYKSIYDSEVTNYGS